MVEIMIEGRELHPEVEAEVLFEGVQSVDQEGMTSRRHLKIEIMESK